MTLNPAYPICGCDISYWQGSIDFDKLADAGIYFVIARTSHGNYLDSRYDAYRPQILRMGFAMGAYHYWDPAYSSTKNAEMMISAQEARLPMGMYLDCEIRTSVSRLQTSRHILDTLVYLDDHYQSYTGLYFSQDSWFRLVDPSYYDRFELDSRPLWVANYISNLSDTAPNLPVGWPRWDVWQFSAQLGPYGGQGSEFGVSSASLDIDAFNGDLAKFNKFIGGSVQPPEPPPPEMPMKVKTITIANIRNAPDFTTASDVGNLDPNEVLEVDADSGQFWKLKDLYVAKSVVMEIIEPPIPPPPTVPEYYVYHDIEKGMVRSAAPNPEVFWFNEKMVQLTEAWQNLIFEMNQPYMTKKWFRANLGTKVAWANGTGFDEPGDPRRDYINGLDLDAKYPFLDKCRICGGATIHGTESNGILTVEVLDGTKPPPKWADLKLKPWLYFRAYIVQLDGSVIDFPYCGGQPLYMPLVGIPPVTVPLNNNVLNKPIPLVKRK